MIAAMHGDERTIGVIEVEIASQLVLSKLVGKTAIFPRLALAQIPYRHGFYACMLLSRFARRLLASSSFARSRGFPLAST